MKQPKLKVAVLPIAGRFDVEIVGDYQNILAGMFGNRRHAVRFARCLRSALKERSMFINHDRGETGRRERAAKAKAAAVKAQGHTAGARKKQVRR